ncbi:MAG: transketolase [Candidatus Micrarchaeia archaeon]
MQRDLKVIAKRVRADIVRMTTAAGSGHPGGSLSAADVVVALYERVLHHRPKQPDWLNRDRFVLSKGHAAPLLYAVLAERGYFPHARLASLRKINSHLQGHPSRLDTPGVEVSTGSLGQGLAMANGMALAAKTDNAKWRVYCLLGDGECDEGEVWEAAMLSHQYKLDNLVAIVDKNGLQIDGRTRDVMDTNPLAGKFRAFGWHAIEINGHDYKEILGAFREAAATKGKPTAIIARTVKGKGVSFMEGKIEYHGKCANPAECARALGELA